MARRRLTRAERERVRREIDRQVRGASTGAPRILLDALRDADPREIQAIVREASEAAAKQLAADTAARMRSAASSAGKLVVGSVTSHAPSPASEWLRTRARAGWRRTSDAVPGWSQRLYGQQTARMGQEIGGALARVTNGIDTVERAAQRLKDDLGFRVPITSTGPGSVRVPRRIVDLEREARAVIREVGNPQAQAALRRSLGQMHTETERLIGTGRGTKAAGRTLTRQVERAIKNMDETALSEAVEWWAWKREQVHMEMVIRTETARAFNEAYVAASAGIPWVTAWEWNTDDDPCDECEEMNGKTMAREDLIMPPLHPNCRCFLTEVVDEDMEPSEEQWAAMGLGLDDAA